MENECPAMRKKIGDLETAIEKHKDYHIERMNALAFEIRSAVDSASPLIEVDKVLFKFGV